MEFQRSSVLVALKSRKLPPPVVDRLVSSLDKSSPFPRNVYRAGYYKRNSESPWQINAEERVKIARGQAQIFDGQRVTYRVHF